MKTASVLFGLMMATSVAHASPAPKTSLPVARTLPVALRAILGQSPAPSVQITLAVARPRADASGDMACGNVMTKTNNCTARIASRQTPKPVAIPRPVVDQSGDVATGNVMKVLKK
jgi:hypothetical protein